MKSVSPFTNVYNVHTVDILLDATLWTTSYATACIITIVARAAAKAQVWAQIIFVCGVRPAELEEMLLVRHLVAIQTNRRTHHGNHF
jgi:hypothetical protein